MEEISLIPLENIVDSGNYDIHPYLKNEPPPSLLLHSIQTFGVLTPPILLKINDTTFDVIAGRKRLQILNSNQQIQSCFCRILSTAQPPEEILAILLEDQFIANGLSLMEQAAFLNLCEKFLPREKQRLSFLNGLPPGRITKGYQYLSQFSQVDASLQKAIHYGSLSEKVISRLLRFTEKDRKLLLYLFEQLRLGFNKQKNLLIEIEAITRREGISVELLINMSDFRTFLNNQEMSAPQKTTKLFDWLTHRNYPLLSNAQAEFRREIEELQLPENCFLLPSAAFEKDQTTLTLNFPNIQAFKEYWNKSKKHLPKT